MTHEVGMIQGQAYKVTVKTTCALHDTTTDSWGEGSDRNYFSCENDTFIVVTEDPIEIYEFFSRETVLSIERINVGYFLVGCHDGIKDEVRGIFKHVKQIPKRE